VENFCSLPVLDRLTGPCIHVLFRSASVFLNMYQDVPVFFDSETGKSGVFQTGNIVVF